MVDLPEQFNAATYFIDRNVLEGRGDRIAIECGEQQVCYRQLLERVNRFGSVLNRLGVRPEERVQILLLDSPEFLYSFFGAIKAGAVAVPTNTFLKPEEYEYILNDTRAPVLVVGETLLPEIQKIPRSRLKYLREVIVSGGPGDGCHGYDQLLAQASPDLAPAPTSKDGMAFWLYSSGSTGAPKGCVHLHHDMVVCSELYAKSILRMTEQDRCYSVARLFFAYGLGNAGYFPPAFGATTILSPTRPTPETIFANIMRYRPTLFFSVPTNYASLLAHQPDGGTAEFDLSSVRHAISAGEPLPAALFTRFKQRFGVEILDALGSTETLHMVISNRPGQVRPGSSGMILPGNEARIVDEHDCDLPCGQIGTLLVKTDATCAGYWNQPEKTKRAIQGPWFHTGDRYYQDEEGYFWYAGRADDLFKVNGRWLSPVEVESALIAHPAVREAAVIAREDESQLEKPVAYVVVSPEFSANQQLAFDLQAWVAEKIGAYKRPRWIEFVSDLPKTATGKLQRFKLRELEARRRNPRSPQPCNQDASGN